MKIAVAQRNMEMFVNRNDIFNTRMLDFGFDFKANHDDVSKVNSRSFFSQCSKIFNQIFHKKNQNPNHIGKLYFVEIYEEPLEQ